jgi:hypothetical protein
VGRREKEGEREREREKEKEKERKKERLRTDIDHDLQEQASVLLDSERLFFFLAHGCHAALDAPKKAPSEAVDRATRVAWSAAGLRKN